MEGQTLNGSNEEWPRHSGVAPKERCISPWISSHHDRSRSRESFLHGHRFPRLGRLSVHSEMLIDQSCSPDAVSTCSSMICFPLEGL